MPAWLLSLAIKLAISFLEAKATSIAKQEAPAVVSRLNVVVANVQSFHSDADFPTGVNGK